MTNKSSNQSSDNKSSLMDQLMASYTVKPVKLTRGEQVKGEVIVINEDEVIVDLGTKAEGVINKKELGPEILENLKVGDEIEAYVASADTDSGQVHLSLYKQILNMGKKSQEQIKKWQKFVSAMQQKTKVSGKVLEVNKGGLMVEVSGIRGFVPSSHLSLSVFTASGSKNLESLVGTTLPLMVIEVDPAGNRLVLSAREGISGDLKEKLGKYKAGEKVKGRIAAIAPFGLFINLDGIEGIVYSQEVSWEKVEDLTALFEAGQEIAVQVTGIDEELGRVNLSVRQLQGDPFEKIAEDFQVDDVVKGTVTNITQNGVEVLLDGDVKGFIPTGKIETGINYTAGQTTNFLVDSIDAKNRRINLAPFLTSTAGLIYK